MVEAVVTLDGIKNKDLCEIARIVKQDWKNVNFAAVPYLQAMGMLSNMSDSYGFDGAHSIVAYFLCNASTWRGEVAKAVKKELNRRLK